MSTFKLTPQEKKRADDRAAAAVAAANAKTAEAKAAEVKAAEHRTKVESVEGVVYPGPYQAYEARLVALELLVALHSSRLAAAQEIPAAHDARLTALEVLVRTQASEIVSRATALAAAAAPPTSKKWSWKG